MIGLSWAIRHPERVRRIIATNTGAFPLPAGKRFPTPLWWGRNTKLGAWLILRLNLFARLAARWCVTRRPLPPEVRAGYLAPHATPAQRLSTLRFVQTIPLSPADPGWEQIQQTAAGLKQFQQTPALLLWGLQDFVFDRHFLAEFQRVWPHAETVTWPDCGHYLLEDAGPEVLDRIEAFLQAHPAR
jgi:haloalkane dehalogenase